MAYEVNLKEFQGPLDLLLHLIEQAEVDIKDIFISEITAQYLEYMGQIDTLDMDTASEFFYHGGDAGVYKSRSLLPKPLKENTEKRIPPMPSYASCVNTGRQKKRVRSSVCLDGARGIYAKLPEELVPRPRR